MIKILKPDFIYNDERGTLVQLVHSGYKQVNVVTSKAGEVRGGHYHKVNKEAFYVVSGRFEITCVKDNKKVVKVFSAGDFFLVKPYVIHEFKYLEDTVLIGLYDAGVEMSGGAKDIFVKKV